MVSASVRQNRPEPVERNSPQYPHPDNPGLIEALDGYYDWAGRRLFLIDGSPDPGTPGAYRYQTRPDLCDLEAPDSDPASPRYEPPHLRHQPGDTWQIGGKPHDPEDPGPYGSPGWYQDRRTGRHRRNELPDPIPPWEADDHDQAEPAQARPEPDRPSPSPSPRRRHRYDADEEPYRFSKLREDAWDRWLIDSEPLAAAHRTTRAAAERECGLSIAVLIRVIRWIIAVVKGPRALEEEPSSTERTADDTTTGIRIVPCGEPEPPRHRPTPYALQWERRFDRFHPATGGGAL